MDVEELIERFEAGVTFQCGCREGRLHPAIIRGLRSGRLDPRELFYCPDHGAALLPAPVEPPARVPAAV